MLLFANLAGKSGFVNIIIHFPDKDVFVNKLCYSFRSNCRETSNKMHQGEIYQDFLKWMGGVGGGVFVDHSLKIIK